MTKYRDSFGDDAPGRSTYTPTSAKKKYVDNRTPEQIAEDKKRAEEWQAQRAEIRRQEQEHRRKQAEWLEKWWWLPVVALILGIVSIIGFMNWIIK